MGMHRYTLVFDYTKTYTKTCKYPPCGKTFDTTSNRTKDYCGKLCSQKHRREKAGVKPMRRKPTQYPDINGNYLRHPTCASWVAEWNAEHPRPTDDRVITTEEICDRYYPYL